MQAGRGGSVDCAKIAEFSVYSALNTTLLYTWFSGLIKSITLNDRSDQLVWCTK